MGSSQSDSVCTQQTFALFEDNLSDTPRLLILHGLHSRIEARTADELGACLTRIENARQAGQWIALAGHYEMGLALEPRLQHILPNTDTQILLQAWVFEHRETLQGDGVTTWWTRALSTLSPAEKEPAILSNHAAWNESRYTQTVKRILAWIQQGDCYQVNLTFPTHGLACGHPLALFHHLRTTQAVRHGVFIRDGHTTILSRSPELFVERTGTTLVCRPMKGTAVRHATPSEDAQSARQLLASPKERAENLMIVDLIRNDLGRLAPPGCVHVNRLFELEPYQTVFQLTSTISASVGKIPLETLLPALFPCGSVTGAPKIRSMEIIAELEDGPRGLYCGALGWLAPEGDFSLNVPIRTMLLDETGHYRLDTGSGIVADADPLAEYRECLSKLGFVRQISEDLELIETIKWAPAHGYMRLPLHLARLEKSARHLGFALDCYALQQTLQALEPQLSKHAHRVRLSLKRNGAFALTAEVLQPISAQPQHIMLAPFALSSRDPRLGHKTSARNFYDKALTGAIKQGLFDLIFCNERNELCEGARSTLFLDNGKGPLVTPALSSGLLPGVLRADLLAQGRAIEAVLPLQTLYQAQKIWMGNSLRGLIEVHLEHTSSGAS